MPSYEFPDDTRIYKLDHDGAADRAAAAVMEIVQMAQDTRIAADPALRPSHAERAAFLVEQHKALEGRPDLLRPIGLVKPLVQMVLTVDGPSRAYETYPTIFVDDGRGKNRPDFYLYAPIDYLNRNFMPAEARAITGEREIDRITAILHTGEEAVGKSVLPLPQRGVATPADFDPARHMAFTDTRPDHTVLAFVAEGRSLDMVDSYRNQIEARTKAMRGGRSMNPVSLHDYPALLGPAPTRPGILSDVPRIETLNGRTLLVYEHERHLKAPAPPDAVPLPTPAYHWLMQNKADETMGIVPPPTPPALAEAIRTGFGRGLYLPPRRRAPPSPGTSQ